MALPRLTGAVSVQTPDQPLLVLDPGHTPQNGGALGARGLYEVVYNDRVAAELKPQLEAAGWRVVLTRQPDENITLQQRVEKANRLQADLFLSIHHDSAQPRYLQEREVQGRKAIHTLQAIRGYSLFVSALDPQFAASYCFARELSQRILPLGRPPTLHHAEPIEGENRPLLHKPLGIYQYDGLAVLRLTNMPAVLLEMGVIVDPVDEAWVGTDAHRQAMLAAIVQAVQAYRRSCLLQPPA